MPSEHIYLITFLLWHYSIKFILCPKMIKHNKPNYTHHRTEHGAHRSAESSLSFRAVLISLAAAAGRIWANYLSSLLYPGCISLSGSELCSSAAASCLEKKTLSIRRSSLAPPGRVSPLPLSRIDEFSAMASLNRRSVKAALAADDATKLQETETEILQRWDQHPGFISSLSHKCIFFWLWKLRWPCNNSLVRPDQSFLSVCKTEVTSTAACVLREFLHVSWYLRFTLSSWNGSWGNIYHIFCCWQIMVTPPSEGI